jgi:hypothetical protein
VIFWDDAFVEWLEDRREGVIAYYISVLNAMWMFKHCGCDLGTVYSEEVAKAL